MSAGRIVLAHATAVLPDRVIDDALVVAEDGVLVEVTAAVRGAVPAEAVDLRGALLLPGLVDTHSDGLEKELRPRPGAEFDVDFAVTGFEGRVRAAGVTTLYHGVGFQTDAVKGRTLAQARRISTALRRRRASGHAVVDHRLLLRVDARDEHALEAVEAMLTAEGTATCPLLSFEDHTPGQGQYRDPEYYRHYVQETEGLTEEQARAKVAEIVSERNTRAWHRQVALEWLGGVARAGRAVLLAHDPVTPQEIAHVHTHGAAVAEFPTTLEAARAAKATGMHVVAGAPNVLRGGSHSGNVAAAELIAEHLVDALSSDYLPTSLLAAVVQVSRAGLVTLPQAVRLVTSGPAEMAGLTDRGRLEPGARADLIAATVDAGWPTARWVHRVDDRSAAELTPSEDLETSHA